MAKKKVKVEKETRRLMESITDLVKKKNGKFKIKAKNKKTAKKIKKSCIHWIIRKKGASPTVDRDPQNPNNWRCGICGESFPIAPLNIVRDENGVVSNPYEDKAKEMLELVNQIQFYSVKLGGDADDTKMFLQLRQQLPRFAKVAKQVVKRINNIEKFDKNKSHAGLESQFDSYYGVSYR